MVQTRTPVRFHVAIGGRVTPPHPTPPHPTPPHPTPLHPAQPNPAQPPPHTTPPHPKFLAPNPQDTREPPTKNLDVAGSPWVFRSQSMPREMGYEHPGWSCAQWNTKGKTYLFAFGGRGGRFPIWVPSMCEGRVAFHWVSFAKRPLPRSSQLGPPAERLE